jgi:peptide deformylase|tara:strand:- start:15480 stop:16025 length:546 start_codon:yes stop_codon:yes gene_type:complete
MPNGQKLVKNNMSLLNILAFPDARLRTVASPVAKIDGAVKNLIADMLETMYAADGIGLAATQVNVHLRIIVIDLQRGGGDPLILINPELEVLDQSTCPTEEGCLSVPGFTETINRPKNICVRALNKEGLAFELEPDGLLAVCIQHEIDHLNGKLFVDYLSSFKQERLKKKLGKQRHQDYPS